MTDLLRMLSPIVDLDVVFSRGFKRGEGGGRVAGGAWSGLGDGPLGKVRRNHIFYAFAFIRFPERLYSEGMENNALAAVAYGIC